MEKIERVDAFAVAYPEPNDSDAQRFLTFARIQTTSGAVGWGEAISQFRGASLATVALIEDMREYLVGQDPTTPEVHWAALRGANWWVGHRGGLFSFALSAVDIALWDLAGKLTGRSLGQLIGATRDRLPAVASTHAFRSDLEWEVARHAEYVRSKDYVGVKIGMGKRGEARLGYDVGRDVRFVHELRAACGDEAWLMMDRGQSLRWSYDDAARRIGGFADAGLKWIEEPFEPDAIREFRRLRQRFDLLIAGGEREWDEFGYRTVLDRGVLDVVGVDPGRVGGVTGTLRIIRLIEEHGAVFNSHAWSSAVNTAASIALSASTSASILQELKPIPSPMQHEIVRSPIGPNAGFVDVPTGPGLGVEVDEAALLTYRIT